MNGQLINSTSRGNSQAAGYTSSSDEENFSVVERRSSAVVVPSSNPERSMGPTAEEREALKCYQKMLQECRTHASEKDRSKEFY